MEPLWLLGVSLLQYCERIPDRQAGEMLRYHVGWNFALHRVVGQPVFHPTSLVYFRRRLLDHQQSRLLFDQILEGLMEAKLIKRKASQRLDSTQMWGLLSQMGRLECVRESLRLALEELAGQGLKSTPAFGRSCSGVSSGVKPWIDAASLGKLLQCASHCKAGSDRASIMPACDLIITTESSTRRSCHAP